MDKEKERMDKEEEREEKDILEKVVVTINFLRKLSLVTNLMSGMIQAVILETEILKDEIEDEFYEDEDEGNQIADDTEKLKKLIDELVIEGPQRFLDGFRKSSYNMENAVEKLEKNFPGLTKKQARKLLDTWSEKPPREENND